MLPSREHWWGQHSGSLSHLPRGCVLLTGSTFFMVGPACTMPREQVLSLALCCPVGTGVEGKS